MQAFACSLRESEPWKATRDAGRLDHIYIVGPVADGEHVGRQQTFFIAQPGQDIQFRGSPEDRLPNLSRRFPVY